MIVLSCKQDVSDVIAQSRELVEHLDAATRQDLLKICSELDDLSNSLTQLNKAAKVRNSKKLQTTTLIHIWNIYFVLGQYDRSACSCGKAGREDIASESVDEGGTVEKVCFSLPRCCGSA